MPAEASAEKFPLHTSGRVPGVLGKLAETGGESMSGVYIKGMEMPKSCYDCPLQDDECFGSIKCCYAQTWGSANMRAVDCPLIPDPDHGRLVDADALITTFCEWGTRLERGRKFAITMCEAKQAIVGIIEGAPTIIPADKKEEK